MPELTIEEILEQYTGDELNCVIIEEGDWINDHKNQFKTDIIQLNNKYYEIMQSRSGSYWSDYEYNDSQINEVYPTTKMIEVTTWSKVNES